VPSAPVSFIHRRLSTATFPFSPDPRFPTLQSRLSVPLRGLSLLMSFLEYTPTFRVSIFDPLATPSCFPALHHIPTTKIYFSFSLILTPPSSQTETVAGFQHCHYSSFFFAQFLIAGSCLFIFSPFRLTENPRIALPLPPFVLYVFSLFSPCSRDLRVSFQIGTFSRGVMAGRSFFLSDGAFLLGHKGVPDVDKSYVVPA